MDKCVRKKVRLLASAAVKRATLAFCVAFALYGSGEVGAAQAAPDRQALLSLAYSEHDAGHRMQALAYCQEVLARWPNDRDARALTVRLLSELGAVARAKELAQSLPLSAGNAERARLAADYASHEIRWAQGTPRNPLRPYDEADKAVDDIRRLINDPATPADVRQRARFDLLVALDQGDRTAEVLAVYAPMRQQGISLPPYAERAVADAMMQRHRAREAVALYEDSIRRDPGPYDSSEVDPRISLAYAYFDAGRIHDAFATVDALVAHEPRWLHLRGVRDAKQNPRKVDADSTAAQLAQYAGESQKAYATLSAMSAEAPANANLRRQLAMAELARGWPRRAADTLKIADTLDAHDVNAALDTADALRAVNDYAQMQTQLELAQQQAGRSGRVQDALTAWDRVRGWQLDLSHDNGRGNSPDYGDRDQETTVTLASPLIGNHWRILALARASSAALPEGHVARERAGLGVQAYMTGFEFYVQALPAVDRYVRKTDVEAGFNWALNDHWSLASDWSSAGADIPLRAQYYGITGNTFSTAVQWRASELTSARLAVYRDRFSDGNLRKGWLGDFVQRLHTGPNVSVDGGIEIGGSSNSKTDRPYFNPSRDRSYALTGSVQNVLDQYVDRTWSQRFDVALGQYAERGYASGWMASMRYGQTFQPHAGLRFGWGLSWHWQPYDGRHESRVALDVTMHWGE